MPRVDLTGDELDSIACNCGDCWSRPGEPCRVIRRSAVLGTVLGAYGKFRSRPHPARVDRARRRSVLGGVGRALLEGNFDCD